MGNLTFLGSSRIKTFPKSTSAYKGGYKLEKSVITAIGNVKRVAQSEHQLRALNIYWSAGTYMEDHREKITSEPPLVNLENETPKTHHCI